MAEEVLNACDEQIGREEGTDEVRLLLHTLAPLPLTLLTALIQVAASSAVQLMRALKNKNIDAVGG